jgi:hypothetical protein
MNSRLVGVLAALAMAAGWLAYGWRGVLMTASVTVFWLLLQFSRALRVMKHAAQSPLGRVDNAVMFQSRLEPGLSMLQVLGLTKSLGHKVGDSGDVWRWADEGGCAVTLTFRKGKLAAWVLDRPAEPAP